MEKAKRTPRNFGYGRVSTDKQEESLKNQKDSIRRYAEYNTLGEIEVYFIDAAVSGKIPLRDRAAGKEMLLAVRPGDNVIIAKIDRAFRSLKDCLEVLEGFQRQGVRIHICDLVGGSFDLTSPMGQFLIQILAAVAELERNYISIRTKEGLRSRKRAGIKYTRHAGYGFTWEKQKDIATGKKVRVKVPCPEEREVMKKIAMWRIQDQPFGWDEIVVHLATLGIRTKDDGVWDSNRVRRACRAEFMIQSKEQRSNR